MIIRELKKKDIDRIILWMHDADSKEIFEKDFSKYKEKDVLAFINSKNENEIHLACANDNDEYLGTVSLKNINNSDAEYAISFCKDAQGSGAALFATKRILKIAFEELKLEKVYLNVLETNKRAISFYKKVGFMCDGISKDYIEKNNKYVDLLWFSFCKAEWHKKYNKSSI